jgi:hypothetical protein
MPTVGVGDTVVVCLSCGFGLLADSGTMLAATTYSLETPELPDTEYALALLPQDGGLVGFELRNVLGFPSPQQRKNTLNLRLRKAKSEAQRPESC